MEQVPQSFLDQISTIVLGYGLIGVVAAIGWIAVYTLYKRNQELNSALVKLGQDAIAGQITMANTMQSLREAIVTLQATTQKLSDLIIGGKVK